MPKKNLEKLIAGIEVVGSLGDRNREIEHIAFDSRKVRQGSLFVAIPGKKYDGKTFLKEAMDKGAVAVIAQSSLKSLSSLITKKNNTTTLCVVEEPLDVFAIERAGIFKGIYHVLHGSISPVDGIGPDDLKLNELLERVNSDSVKEVVIATNPNLSGEATAMYIYQRLSSGGARVTRLARGLPVGGDLEYADEITLMRSLEGRQDM